MPVFSGGPGLWRRVRLILDPASVTALKRDSQKALADATNPRVASANLGIVNRAVGFLRQQFVGMAAAIGSVFAARQIVDWADNWRLIAGRLELVTKDQEELAMVQERLFAITQETRTEYEATAALFQRTALNAAQLGRTTEDILDLTKAVQQAIRVSGANQAEANAGVVQFSQALASGTLRGDEFRSVMENLPGLARAIADGLGVTRGQLRAMSADGKLTAEQVVGAVLKMKDRIARDFESVPLTVRQAFTVLGNEIMRFVGMADEGASASENFARSLVTLADKVHELADAYEQDLGRRMGQAIADLTQRAGEGLLSLLLLQATRLNLELLKVRRNLQGILGMDTSKLDEGIRVAQQQAFDLFEKFDDAYRGAFKANTEMVEGAVKGHAEALTRLEQQAANARDRAAREATRSARDAQLDILDTVIKTQERLIAETEERIKTTPFGEQRESMRQQLVDTQAYVAELENVRKGVENVGAAWIGLDTAQALSLEELHKIEKERVSALVEARDLGLATAAENEEIFQRAADYNQRLREGNLALNERLRIAGLLNQIMEQLLQLEVRERRTPRRAPLTDAQRDMLSMDDFVNRAFTDAETENEARRAQEQAAEDRAPSLVRGGKAPTLRQLGIVDPEVVRTEMDALKDHWFQTHEDLVEAGTNAAYGWANAWSDAFGLLFEEGGNFRDFMRNVFKGLGAAAFGFLAEFAGRKVKENVARGLEAIAGGFVDAVLYKDPTAIGRGIAASKMAFAAAAAWGVLGGGGAALQGAASGGGSAGLSGGLPTGARDPAGRGVDRLEPKGDIINIYVSGVDPDNPRHQELIGKAQHEWGGREGNRITVHKWTGD